MAIPDPAPSIPARFRLYHGGSARRGYLVTQNPETNAYLGDYVYFSSLKEYAREYLHPKRRVPASLFVIDARYLPHGTRVLRNQGRDWPPRSVMGRLFDLIDMQSEIKTWIRTLENSSARTMLDADAPAEVVNTVVVWLRLVRYLRRVSRDPGSAAVISARVLRTLQAYLARFLGPRLGDSLAQLAPLEEAYACSDRWRSVVLFLLDTFGTLDLSADQLRSALGKYREGWLAEFTTPLTASNLDAMRQLGVADNLEAASLDEDLLEENAGKAFSGVIVIVPGAIPVLDARLTEGARKRRR